MGPEINEAWHCDGASIQPRCIALGANHDALLGAPNLGGHDIVLFASGTNYQGHFATGGIELRMLSTFPPVFSPNVVPRS